MGLIKESFEENSNINRIVLENKTITELRITAEELYDIISELLLDRENLFYYCTQRKTCRTLKSTKKYVKKLIKQKILNQNVDEVLMSMGWDKNHLNISNSVFQGDLGEYLMNIVIEKMDISKSLISKVSLKTSPSMPAYGNDNIFYDLNSNTLYFGESKFRKKTKEALLSTYNSIQIHKSSLTEISYIKNHTSDFISESGAILKRIERKFETIDPSQVKINSISFVMTEDKYTEPDYKEILDSLVTSKQISNDYITNSIIVFLPIISKCDFLQFFEKKVNSL